MLNIHRRKHVDSRIEQVDYIFVSFAVLAALDIGMSKFVNDRHFGLSSNDRIQVHLLEGRTFVHKLSPRNGRQFCREFNDRLATMGFDYAYNHIFATTVPANSLAKHAVGFAHTGGIAEKQLKQRLLLWRRIFQPLLWRLVAHDAIVTESRRNAASFMQFL